MTRPPLGARSSRIDSVLRDPWAAPVSPLAKRIPVAAACGAVADILAFAAFSLAALNFEAAQAASYAIALAVAIGVGLGARRPEAFRSGGLDLRVGIVVAILAYLLRAGVLSLAAVAWGWPPVAAIVPAALCGALVAGLGMVRIALASGEGLDADHGRAAALLGIAFLLAARVVYMGQLELIPQEAYYWSYAQRLDIGYLDHPPLVAWLIALSTTISSSEFFVRLPALLSWCVMAIYVAMYARETAGPAVAWQTALLASALPFFFVVGWLITPDAPLAAAWAAALYYLHRALIAEQPRAWIGAGAAIGLGMLSKYSMILVGGAALVFVLLDARSRRVLVQPWAWAGALLALALFAPVIAWNLQHDGASLAFQSTRRVATPDRRFEFHLFLLYILIVITPWGLAGLLSTLSRAHRRLRLSAASPASDPAIEAERRRWRFVVVFTVVPLAAFAVPSLWSETKLHWTGPIWLAGLPAMAASFRPSTVSVPDSPLARFLRKTWVPLLHTLMVGMVFALFYYPVYGLAGLRAHHAYLHTGWRDLRAQVQKIEDAVHRETGERPAIVGLDKHNIANQMAYYGPPGDAVHDTASRHLFFGDALMYEWWSPPARYDGRDLVVVARSRNDVEDPRLAERASRLGPVHELLLRKHGADAGRYYARVVYGYRAPAPATFPVQTTR